MKEIYEKVWIKTEADLPKVKGEYFVHIKEKVGYDIYSWYGNDSDPVYWMYTFDWYLQPIEPAEQKSAEELDLIQYVTNLLYYAFSFNGPTKVTNEFDKWVEMETNNIKEYASQFKQTELTDEEIEKEALRLGKIHAKQSVGDFAVGYNWGAKAVRDQMKKDVRLDYTNEQGK